jgi:hypothetical protein
VTDAIYIRKSRVTRIEGDCAPCIAFGLEGLRGEQFFFSMADAEAYDFIRRLNTVLFDADPPRSGVGSPEDAARSE